MVDVRVCQQDVRDPEGFGRDELEEAVHFVARIDQHAGTRARTGDDKPVLVERSDRLRLDYDHVVILAILDDLMFTSKIRSAATLAGLTVAVARSTPDALERMRADPPALVILDLNNPRTDPLGILRAMKTDAALAAVPTVGFVAHVDTATIQAARDAGIDDVMPRSAFSSGLVAVLERARS
jgi:CheY-like chemotaxis protein